MKVTVSACDTLMKMCCVYVQLEKCLLQLVNYDIKYLFICSTDVRCYISIGSYFVPLFSVCACVFMNAFVCARAHACVLARAYAYVDDS
jgi:hypothetical protein